MLNHTLYNLTLRAATPLARLWLARHPRYAPLTARFQPQLPPGCQGAIWIHACSLGEVNTARPLLERLEAEVGERPVVLSASTLTGMARAQELHGSHRTFYCPFDTPRAIQFTLDALRPAALVLIETEIWPNLITACAGRAIPVLVVNARLSDRHFKTYHRLRWLFRPVFQKLSRVCAQSELHAERFLALGTRKDRVQAAGSLKYDAVALEVDRTLRERLRRACGIPEKAPVLLFGSTRPGDEALASACWATLREEVPDLRLVIAPRHLARTAEVLACFSEPVLCRSALLQGAAPKGERVLLLDTLGELTHFYALATVAVIGGSFYPGVDGHNPLEAAALGVPAVFGPFMANFAEPAATLVAAKGALQVSCAEDLYGVLSDLLAQPAGQRHMGTLARKIVLTNRGALLRNVIAIREHLPPGDAAEAE